jgi:DNA invertase Pin-like site-specific DNA recombinase
MARRSLNEARVYLRRSRERQENGIHAQLGWAIAEAARYGVKLDAQPADLEHMLLHNLSAFKGVYLDNGISGSDLQRPALTACREELLSTRNVSHLFIHMADRFARPEQAQEAMMMEIELLYAGITVVFRQRISLPRERGRIYFAEDMLMLYEYTESGAFLMKLAERVVDAQRRLASQGNWSGGNAPYGFVRVLVSADNQIVRELAPKEYVRMEGHHVKIVPKYKEKIEVWTMILRWYQQNHMGFKKIATKLNGMGIPSPNAGKTRSYQGHVRQVPGRWSPNQVSQLIRNCAIIGLNRYGAQSEGKFRRHSTEGARNLDDRDLTPGGVPRVIKNPDELQIIRPTGFKNTVVGELYAPEALFEECQGIANRRGVSQRGITKQKDPSRYLLAMRTFDMNCGHPMYAKTATARKVFVCGLYDRTAGDKCHHNLVDSNALETTVLKVLKQKIAILGGRSALRSRIQKLAAAAKRDEPAACERQLQQLAAKLAQLENERDTVGRNLATAATPEERQITRAVFEEKLSSIRTLQGAIEEQRTLLARVDANSPDNLAEHALALYDRLEDLLKNDASRQRILEVIERLNVRVWLSFGEGKKGERVVRRLTGGLITLGSTPPPVSPYGQPPKTDSPDSNAGGVVGKNDPERRLFVTAPDQPSQKRVSFHKGIRGDRI